MGFELDGIVTSGNAQYLHAFFLERLLLVFSSLPFLWENEGGDPQHVPGTHTTFNTFYDDDREKIL